MLCQAGVYNTAMFEKKIQFVAARLDAAFFDRVRQPARYIGGEVNEVRKAWEACEFTVALCFPDIYEVAMSHTGLSILYHLLNEQPTIAAERVFAPWIDAEAVLRREGIALFSLESKATLASFDMLGFTLSNELCYTNVLNMLDLGGLAVRAADRRENDPLVIGGGGMAHCCEPIAPFFDGFVLGDGEEAILELIDWIKTARQGGLAKQDMLTEAARRFPWFYVPALVESSNDGQGRLRLRSLDDQVSLGRTSAVVRDFEHAFMPTRPIVPWVEAVHERVCLEIMRGCPGRCRFCQVSFCKRPIRIRSVDRLVEAARQTHAATGYDTITLLSLSSAEYPHLESLVTQLHQIFESQHVGISVPSLRVDRQLRLLPQLVASVRKSGLTIAVEAATERLRGIINKPISNEDLFAAVEAAYQAGWQKLKLYFIIGIPGETLDDVAAIVALAEQLALLKKKWDRRTAQINVTVSGLVPKPHTPLAWLGQKPREYYEQAKERILAEKRQRGAKFLKFKFHDLDRSRLETVLGRGDRRLAEVIEHVWREGARFDLWDECFDLQRWTDVLARHRLELNLESRRDLDSQVTCPWDHLGGPDKGMLLRHFDQVRVGLDPTC